jgi:hypothetical protein
MKKPDAGGILSERCDINFKCSQQYYNMSRRETVMSRLSSRAGCRNNVANSSLESTSSLRSSLSLLLVTVLL